MWDENNRHCENNCQCSGLITENFKINSGNNATKRKQSEALSTNYKIKMNPHSLDFNRPVSPITPKRRVLGEIQTNRLNSIDRITYKSPTIDRLSSPLGSLKSPNDRLSSPLASSFNTTPINDRLNSPLASSFKTTPIIDRISAPLGCFKNSPTIDRLSSPLGCSFKSPTIDRINGPLGCSFKNSPSMDRLSSPLSTIKNTPNIERKSSPLASSFKNTPTIDRIGSPLSTPTINRLQSPLIDRCSPLTSRKRSTKIGRILEERSKFKMCNKENKPMETFMKLDVEEETRDCSFSYECSNDWSMTKLDFTDALQSRTFEMETPRVDYVPQKDLDDLDPEFETLHDLEEEFVSQNFDQCNKYEIISTDSPNIISRGRSTSRKITSKNLVFGAPLAETEASTSFNKPNASATRMLNFEDSFEFTSPVAKRPTIANVSVKKSLKFNETPTKLRHERSDSSIGSMSSPGSSKLRIFPSESTTSMESGFISELEEPFLDIEEISNSPKMANFNELLSGQIKDNFVEKEFHLRRPMERSMSFNPEISKAKCSLFPITESPGKRSQKRLERSELEVGSSKRRKSNCLSPKERLQRPVLQRAFSENNASIMSALARSVVDPDLIGDFSLPFALPLTGGHHPDLKSVTCDTLAALLRGDYCERISEFQVIDCRYPYEFEGGHILGAVNLYTPSQVLALVNEPLQPREENKRSILVFHCEFSLERGPKLSRFLRSSDRAKNKENYPALHYPEVYLLHEGYRAFYQRYPDLCSPAGYTAMLDPQHRHLLRQHRSVQQPSSSTHHRRNRLLL